MGLNVREMENSVLYGILDNWYVIRYKNTLLQTNTIYVYGFDEQKRVRQVGYGKLVKDNEETAFTINGWIIEKGFTKDADYQQIGDSKTAKHYRYGISGLYELKGRVEADLKKEIMKFWLNPKNYFEQSDTIEENNTVDGNDPINWEEVIKNNTDIGGRKHH